jgi:hypothetical protein
MAKIINNGVCVSVWHSQHGSRRMAAAWQQRSARLAALSKA